MWVSKEESSHAATDKQNRKGLVNQDLVPYWNINNYNKQHKKINIVTD
jgi:hypothetical protein